MTTKEILTNAASLLETHGRTIGALFKPNGCICPLGAIALASWPEIADEARKYSMEQGMLSGTTDELYKMLKKSAAVITLAHYLTNGVATEEGCDPVFVIFSWNDGVPQWFGFHAIPQPTSTEDAVAALRACAEAQP